MSQKRLGTFPRTKRLQEVVALLDRGESVARVAAGSPDAAKGALSRAANYSALTRAFWLLTQLPLAARQTDLRERLRELALPVGSNPQLFESHRRLF
jgi:antitoxin (DNA-binding transcriptional repressor) of toxin-antitoxin stability system